MGRAKKYKKSSKADQQHLTIRAIAKKREERVLKPGMFNVFAVSDWIVGFNKF